jgi:hypothetical protein
MHVSLCPTRRSAVATKPPHRPQTDISNVPDTRHFCAQYVDDDANDDDNDDDDDDGVCVTHIAISTANIAHKEYSCHIVVGCCQIEASWGNDNEVILRYVRCRSMSCAVRIGDRASVLTKQNQCYLQ